MGSEMCIRDRIRSLRCRVLVGRAADTASLATCVPFGKLFVLRSLLASERSGVVKTFRCATASYHEPLATNQCLNQSEALVQHQHGNVMQLSFAQRHVSITSLEADPLPKFAAITGLNGAGKTHLLQAILAGRVKVAGVTPAEIVYFNYGDFSVDPKYNATQAADKGKHDQSTHCLLYTSPSPRDLSTSRMPSSA